MIHYDSDKMQKAWRSYCKTVLELYDRHPYQVARDCEPGARYTPARLREIADFLEIDGMDDSATVLRICAQRWETFD